MKQENKHSKPELNYDVYNALNLYNPALGEAYEKTNWNPLGEDFSLGLPFIEKFLENARYKPEIKAPSFLEKGDKNSLKTFQTARERNKEVLNELQTKLNNGDFKNVDGVNIEEQIKDIIFILHCRDKLLENIVAPKNNKFVDLLKAHKELSNLNARLSELMEEMYYEEFKKQTILQNLILQAQIEAKMQKSYNPQFSKNFNRVLKMSKNFDNRNNFVADSIAKTIETVVNLAEKFVDTLGQTISNTIEQTPRTNSRESIQERAQRTFESPPKDRVTSQTPENTPTKPNPQQTQGRDFE